MKRFVNRKSILSVVVALTLIVAFTGGILLRGHSASAASVPTTKSKFCSKLGKTIQASSGAQVFCFGAQLNGPAAHRPVTRTFSGNVDAANPAEDVSPAGVQSYGQSETSIAAASHYTVEAWNDATGFFSNCGAPQNKEELTGLGFSANSGASFTDLGGVPNAGCNNDLYEGDPSVEAWTTGGKTYFYVSSLFDPTFSNTTDARSKIAMAACVASGQGSSATLSCSQPIIIASSSECLTFPGPPPFTFCSFLDKDFLSIDPVHGLLYATFTEFGLSPATVDREELAVCDIGNGALGGTPGAPVCTNGASGSQTSPAAPYLVVAPTDPNFCENEGAYPAADLATGDVYVAYEHNWASPLFGGPCASEPVQGVMNFIPHSCLTLPAASCSGPAVVNAVNIVSLQGAFIPGYNRFPMNDFPRLAVSDTYSTVSMVWNDGRFHLAGDILMQSMNLGTLGNVTGAPVVLNSDRGGWHFLPGLRNVNQKGLLNVSWYSRASANTALTDVTAAVDVNPRTTATPHNILVTNVSSDWNAVSSDIFPNFGDYTDNYTIGTTGLNGGSRDFVAWSDGRLGDPQPFEANTFS
jgi:hypothetical protein